MGLFKPARNAAMETSGAVCDLDVILEKSFSFKLHGKVYEIAPITTEAFYHFVNGVLDIQKKSAATPKDLNQLFYSAVHPICKKLSIRTISRMTMVQKGALLELLSAKIMGKNPEDLKKKQ